MAERSYNQLLLILLCNCNTSDFTLWYVHSLIVCTSRNAQHCWLTCYAIYREDMYMLCLLMRLCADCCVQLLIMKGW